MEKEESKNRNSKSSESIQNPILTEPLKEIEDIKEKIELFNTTMNNKI